MPRAAMRVCGVHGCPAVQAAALCEVHRADRDRHQRRTTPTKVTRDWAERKRRAAEVDEHIARHGYVCPGYKRPPHRTRDLTADHVHEISQGGDPRGRLEVLCRSCNSAKAGQRT